MKNNKNNWQAKQEIADYFYGDVDFGMSRLMGRADMSLLQQNIIRPTLVRTPAKHAILWDRKL